MSREKDWRLYDTAKLQTYLSRHERLGYNPAQEQYHDEVSSTKACNGEETKEQKQP